jgi:NAD(P)-dependent dehydrogenase (short-subunit alcohol dehydrogenase family)
MNKRIAIVTGGASGLGKACVELFLQQGMKVAVWDKETHAPQKDALLIACDVTEEESVSLALHQTIEQLGIPTVCINCAGIAPAALVIGKNGVMPLSFFQQVISVNLIGTFNVMRLVAEAMSTADINAQGERGVIINTASVAAFEGQKGQVPYSASKGAIVAMTLPAAREFAQHAIRVNAIAPGLFATPLLKKMPEEVQERLAASVTFPQRLGKPEEFAALALHIIENPLLNGEVIRLDGALRMQAK